MCKILQDSERIVQDISHARAMQVLHARFLHNLARILHDLASSFLLGPVKWVSTWDSVKSGDTWYVLASEAKMGSISTVFYTENLKESIQGKA